MLLGIVGMGKVQQQFFPDSSRPEILVDLWFPEGHLVRGRTKRWPSAWRQRVMQEAGVKTVTHLDRLSGVPRFYLPLDQVFPQSNVSRRPSSCSVKDLKVRESAAPAAAGADWRTEFPEVRTPREAAAQRAAGAVPCSVPRDRHRCPGSCASAADEVKAVLRGNAQHARRERQLERER